MQVSLKGASKGEGLGNKFLSHIRQVDAIAQVIRCFDDPNITHVAGSIDSIRDIEIINTELCLADLESVEKRKQRIEKIAKSGDKDARAELPLLERIIEGLGEAKPVRAQGLNEEELEMIKELTLLTAKPSLYVANISEDEVSDYSANEHVKRVEEYAKNEGAGIVVVSARIESEIAELSDEESAAFLEDLGLEESGLTKLIKASYALLGLINYFTAGEMEARAWTIVNGTKAPQAAGKFTPILKKALSALKSYPSMTYKLAAAKMLLKKRPCSPRRQGICYERRRRNTLPLQRIMQINSNKKPVNRTIYWFLLSLNEIFFM